MLTFKFLFILRLCHRDHGDHWEEDLQNSSAFPVALLDMDKGAGIQGKAPDIFYNYLNPV
jgi:hypothetical protein